MEEQAIIRDHGGVLVRFLQGLKLFKLQTGKWPEKFIVDQQTLFALKVHHLTPKGFKRLNEKLAVQLTENESTILFSASNTESKGYTDRDKPWDNTDTKMGVGKWLFGIAIYPDI